MAELNFKNRNSLRSASFGLPKERKYPMPDKAHAANAKARATQMEKAGKLSSSERSKIDAKANRILGTHSEKESEMHSKEHHHAKAAHHHAKAAHHHEMAAHHAGGKKVEHKKPEHKREAHKKVEHKKPEHKKEERKEHNSRARKAY